MFLIPKTNSSWFTNIPKRVAISLKSAFGRPDPRLACRRLSYIDTWKIQHVSRLIQGKVAVNSSQFDSQKPIFHNSNKGAYDFLLCCSDGISPAWIGWARACRHFLYAGRYKGALTHTGSAGRLPPYVFQCVLKKRYVFSKKPCQML